MEANVEKNSISSALTQTDLVASPILWQCLYVIRTVSEFQNLTYRVTKTGNDMEVVVVYREGILGIFGPPVDPIMLTLDPKGRCLLTVLFKPVERVSIVSPENGQIEIASLLAVLRLIAGKGYLFCPGLPERFLAGKACGKFVVLHKVPFKRYQSSQCPVYYQATVTQQNKSSLCALCPRCMQAAKWIHALPTFASNAAGTAAQLPSKLTILDQRSAAQGVSTRHNVISQTNDSTKGNAVPPAFISKLLSFANFKNNTVTSVSSEPQILKNNLSGNQQMPGVDVNGNCQNALALKGSDIVTNESAEERGSEGTSVGTKVQVLKALLTNLLQEGCKKKSLDSVDLSTEITGEKAVSGETDKTSGYHTEKDRHRKSNVCRHCKKQYSTPANLLNHLQRHEALSGTWQKQFRERKLRRRPVFSVMHRMLQGSKLPSTFSKKKPASLSETSIRLFLKCLDDMIPSQNGAKSLKQQGYNAVEGKVVECGTAEKQSNSRRPQLVPYEQAEGETLGKRSSLKRTSSGLSPMQTLLEAAAIAEVGQGDKGSLIIPSPSSLTPGKYQEAAALSTISQLPTVSLEQPEVNVPHKKPRKSSRLASKRAKKNIKKRTGEDESCTEKVEAENAAASHEQSMLTNLNLLSTVSLETAMRQAPTSPQVQAAVFNSVPLTVLSPESMKNTIFPSTTISLAALNASFPAHPTSKSVSIPQQLLNNTSGGNVVISRSQDPNRLLVSSNLQNSSSLPPVPPLLFAGGMQGKGLLYPLLSQKQQSQPQTVPTSTPSILRSLVTVGNSQPNPVVSAVTASDTEAVKNHSPNIDCGAIDLSKPKLPQAKTNIPTSIEKGIDLSSLSDLPHNIAQLVAGNDNPSEVLQCFMMMAKGAGVVIPEQKETKPVSGITNNKQADSELQARMFASAHNYRIDKGIKNSPQVQAVIASSSRVSQTGKGTKPGGAPAVQADEIQCGYKWSGSGGLVKERTQLVRELVPPDVMASILAKPVLSNVSPLQLNVSLFNTSQPRQPSPQLIQSSVPGWSRQMKSQDQSASELALNLITSKAVETAVPNKGVLDRAPSLVLSSSPSLQDWSPASPGSTKRSILKSSLTNKSINMNQQIGHHPSAPGHHGAGSPQKLQPKTLSLSQSSSPSLSSISSTPTPPSICTISSPSLAAMLRQPAAAMYEANHSNALKSSVNSVASLVSVMQRNSVVSNCSTLSLPGGFHIKTEPMDPYGSEQGTIIMALPIKAEIQDSNAERVQDETSRDGDSSPAKLVVDISPDSAVGRDMGEKLKSIDAPISRAPDLANKNTSVRCKQ